MSSPLGEFEPKQESKSIESPKEEKKERKRKKTGTEPKRILISKAYFKRNKPKQKRMSNKAANELISVVKNFSDNLLKCSGELADVAKRVTIRPEDVKFCSEQEESKKK